ncbi:MAG: Lysine--tRNA ligase [Candidatus Anoxychlamydiales bacterium]|nr:Lysine--tRNA ligase [Candidatus Anoxychlamydiales bacterium]NGX35499.1 Lysine--tRNA ligase [Candidatus Anoxychlamydiales bacterium]
MEIKNPHYHEIEEFQNRSSKLKEIKDLGIEPYPHKFQPSHMAKELHDLYAEKKCGHFDDAAAGETPVVKFAGRLILFRAMGKNAFAQLKDESGKIQILFNRDLSKVTGYNVEKSKDKQSHIKFIEKKLDLGDILGIEGNIFLTQKGELTIFVKKVTLLCKTLLPLPDKHSGLADLGVKYRKRWLDLITDPDVINTFIKRSKIIKMVRDYFDEAGFLEVETPILQNIYGGAEAKPFKTHINALHQDMYLRIALEISLKKLLIGGFNKVFEIGKIFRNEGIDKTHNPEFSMIEAYASYWDYNDMMEFTEKLYESIAKKLCGSTKIEFGRHTIDVKTPWKRLSMKKAIKEYGSVDVEKLSDDELHKKLLETSVDREKLKGATRGNLIALLFEELVEDKLIQPHHITDHPIETTPLCKLHRDPKEKEDKIVERFESFIAGTEVLNAYTELNDPQIQRELLVNQAKKRLEGDEEAHPLDEEFIEAICQGMPPASGVGIGIDRLVMLFTNSTSIRDVIFFPIMKPEESS